MVVRKRDRTRKQLLMAAQEILLEHGFPGLSINTLTEKAEMALGTFYNYFRTKEEVADAVVSLILSVYHRLLEEATEGVEDLDEIVAISVRQTMHFIKPQSELGKLLFASNIPFTNFVVSSRLRFVEDARKGVETGVFKYANEQVAVTMIVGGMMGCMMDRFLGLLDDDAVPFVTRQILSILGVEDDRAEFLALKPIKLVDAPELPLSAVEFLEPLVSG